MLTMVDLDEGKWMIIYYTTFPTLLQILKFFKSREYLRKKKAEGKTANEWHLKEVSLKTTSLRL